MLSQPLYYSPITTSEFETKVNQFGKKLVKILINCEIKSIVDQEMSLKCFSKLSANIPMMYAWNQSFEELKSFNKNYYKLGHIIKILCIFVGSKQLPAINETIWKKEIIDLTENLLENQEDKYVKQALHFLCLFVYKMPESFGTLKSELDGLRLKILEND